MIAAWQIGQGRLANRSREGHFFWIDCADLRQIGWVGGIFDIWAQYEKVQYVEIPTPSVTRQKKYLKYLQCNIFVHLVLKYRYIIVLASTDSVCYSPMEVAQQWRRRLSSDGQGGSGKILYSVASISGTLYNSFRRFIFKLSYGTFIIKISSVI